MSKRTPEEEADLISKFWGRVKISGTDGPCIANGIDLAAAENPRGQLRGQHYGLRGAMGRDAPRHQRQSGQGQAHPPQAVLGVPMQSSRSTKWE